MLENETEEIMEIALQFWEKAKEFELGLLRKQIANLFFEDVKKILEQTRLETKFTTLPLQAINVKLKSLKGRGPSGDYTPCYAINMNTGSSREVMVFSQGDEGAKVEMGKYLLKWGHEPTDWVIYVGKDSFDSFFNDRHELHCQLNPRIRETTEKLERIRERGGNIVDVLAGNLSS